MNTATTPSPSPAPASRLTCPRCHGSTREVREPGGPPVDVCRNCHGAWYDDGELRASLGEDYNYDGLMQNMIPGRSSLVCPRCAEPMSTLRFRAAKFELEIDHCLACKGFWLDFGELDVIREIYAYARVRVAGMRPPRPAAPAADAPAPSPAPPAAGPPAPVEPSPGPAADPPRPAPPRPRPAPASPPPSRVPRPSPAPLRAPRPGYDPLDPASLIPPSFPARPRPLPAPPPRVAASTLARASRAAAAEVQDDGSALAHYRSFDHGAVSEYEEISAGTYLFCLFSQLPVEVFNPRKRFPVFLWILIAVNFIVYFISHAMSDSVRHAFAMNFGAIPVHAFTPGGLYTLLTAAFLHANPPHVIGNMYMLYTFGDNVTDVFMDHGESKGVFMFAAYYGVLAVIASAVHCLFELGDPAGRLIPLVGASGAVSGIIAAYWRLFPRVRVYQIFFLYPFKIPISVYLFFWIGWNLMLAGAYGLGSGVSWLAHLGGFAAGWFLLPWFLPFDIEEIRNERPLLA